jgi:hypothetical protein
MKDELGKMKVGEVFILHAKRSAFFLIYAEYS